VGPDESSAGRTLGWSRRRARGRALAVAKGAWLGGPVSNRSHAAVDDLHGRTLQYTRKRSRARARKRTRPFFDRRAQRVSVAALGRVGVRARARARLRENCRPLFVPAAPEPRALPWTWSLTWTRTAVPPIRLQRSRTQQKRGTHPATTQVHTPARRQTKDEPRQPAAASLRLPPSCRLFPPVTPALYDGTTTAVALLVGATRAGLERTRRSC